jgi:hypothetical protein
VRSTSGAPASTPPSTASRATLGNERANRVERDQLHLLLPTTRQCPGMLAEFGVHETTSTGILARQDTT